MLYRQYKKAFYYYFFNSLTSVRVFISMVSDNPWCSLWASSSLRWTSHVTITRVPSPSGEAGKTEIYHPNRERARNSVQITVIREIAGISVGFGYWIQICWILSLLGRFCRFSRLMFFVYRKKTYRSIGHFHVSYVTPKLIGWFQAIPSVMTNEMASYNTAEHYFQRWRQCTNFSAPGMISGNNYHRYYIFKAFLVIKDV